LTQTPLQYSATPPPPSLAQCIANPALTGCSAVLPTLAQCTATPTTAGCTSVLPAAIANVVPVAQTQAAVYASSSYIFGLAGNGGIAGMPTPNSNDKSGNQNSTGALGGATNGNSSTKPGVTNDTTKKMYCN